MSNQRVVVLTDEMVHFMQGAVDQVEWGTEVVLAVSCLVVLQASVEYPKGITDDMVERGKHAFARETLRTHASMSQLDAENDLVVRSVLEAALIPESSSQMPVWDCPKGHRFDAHRRPLGAPGCPFCGSTQATIVGAALIPEAKT